MAITGTKVALGTTLKNYFVNECSITDVEVMDSQYTDMSLKLQLEDNGNGYNYNCFVNQNFQKDANGIVNGMLFPEDLNTLFISTKCDLNVSDTGVLDTKSLESLVGKHLACITYTSSGKYKRNTWGVVSHIDEKELLEKKFLAQLEKGYPKDYQKVSNETEPKVVNSATNKAVMDKLINNDANHDNDEIPF